MRLVISFMLGLVLLSAFATQIFCADEQPATQPAFISLPEKPNNMDTYFYKQVQLPEGKIIRAWTAISAHHEYTLYINGKEASKSRYGRFASAFRLAEEIENIAGFLKPGINTFTVKVHRWSQGIPALFIQSEVQIENAQGTTAIPVFTDATWIGSYDAPKEWTSSNFKPAGWMQVTAGGPFGRQSPRIRKDLQSFFLPRVQPPLPQSVLAEFPQISDMSDWQQQVVSMDIKAQSDRFMEFFKTKFVADRYAEVTGWQNTHMGDSYSINSYPIGNGIVFTIMGWYPFYNTGVILGPEYQSPVQWNMGTSFAGDAVSVFVGDQPIGFRDAWMWKIRGTDVIVSAAKNPDGKIGLYTLTFAPPDLKALIRVYAVSNLGEEKLANVTIRNSNARVKPKEKTLTEIINHPPMPDAAGDANTRGIITGVFEDNDVTASFDEPSNTGWLDMPIGDIEPGATKKRLIYHVTYLETVNEKPVEIDADQTLAKVKERNYKLLDDTINDWKSYIGSTTTLEAPGDWGRRVADYIDDVKILVQVQQFKRTGAVGPMWFFSDQWIRDACGPMKSFLRTGRFEEARRVIDYHYLASIACKKILNWLPMDVDIYKEWEPVTNWSQITMNYADRHANCEVPSWIILQHYWYFKFSGDTKTINDHWDYLTRCFYGQYDNEFDKIFRPDFKIPFHGDETYIYSGGEALWGDRYDLTQNSYPGGNIYSADSSFELVAAGDALAEMGKYIGQEEEAAKIGVLTKTIRETTEKYYWMPELGSYAQGMSVLYNGQLNRYPMANIQANVIWSGYSNAEDDKAVSNVLRMMEYLMEQSGVFNPIVGYDVAVGMLQGQCLHSLAAINHPWAERAFYALLMISGDTTEYSEWMAPGDDYRTMYRANRTRPWEAGINLDAALYYLSGFEPDALAKKFSVTPRLPTGVYSPIAWDNMTLKHLPMGKGNFDLTVEDKGDERTRTRTYTIVSHSPDDVNVDLNVLISFADLKSVKIDGKTAKTKDTNLYSQVIAPVTALLPAGKTVTITAEYQPKEAKPVMVTFKEFLPPAPTFDKSDIVIFSSLPKNPNVKLLRDVLAEKYKAITLDATLPTDPSVFKGALLTDNGIKTRLLLLDERAMGGNRKENFWWNPAFDEIIGTFIKRGGVVLEASGNMSSSKWLEKTLAPSTFNVTFKGGNVLALDKRDEALDKAFYWLDEKGALEDGKWSAYWAGTYTMKYVGGDATISDGVAIWGEQEQAHGCMQYDMKTTPGKDHLIRIRTWPRPKKGFTLQSTEDGGQTWNVVEELWVPIPEDPEVNGWVYVYLTLPAKYVTKERTSFRIGEPKGSAGGIGHEGYASTGAARIWIRDSLEKPPSMADIKTTSAYAEKFGLKGTGIVAFSGGTIGFDGFASPYRILGASDRAAVIFKPIGNGLYVRSELTNNIPAEELIKFVDVLMNPTAWKAALTGVQIGK